jgi:hypothetical protein
MNTFRPGDRVAISWDYLLRYDGSLRRARGTVFGTRAIGPSTVVLVNWEPPFKERLGLLIHPAVIRLAREPP